MNKSTGLLFAAMAMLMAVTRSHHFASVTHLPDASLAVFFLAGFYLAPRWAFAALLGLAAFSDWLAMDVFGVSDFCVSPAYVFLLPAYGVLWFAGRRLRAVYRLRWAGLVSLSGYGLGGILVSELFSSGGFYFFSGRFTDTTWTVFIDRLAQYVPGVVQGFAFYLGAAAVAHVALTLAGRAASPPVGAD